MISVDQALAQIDSLLPTPLEAELVPLENALHRVLREPAISPEDQPPIDRSSIDGYLVHPDQNKGSVRLLSAHPPGQPTPPLPPLGSAVRILTGSSLPAHAVLIMQEDALLTEPGLIELLKECEPIVQNMSSFIRFVLINLYSIYEDADLYKAQMLFHKHGEIPMYTYLTNTLDKSKVDIMLYVYGLNYEDLEAKYKLELYYISYEKKNNLINFENNIFNLINKK